MYRIQWSIEDAQGNDSYDNWRAASDGEVEVVRRTLREMAPVGSTLTVRVTRVG